MVTGFGASLDGVARGWGGGVLDEGVAVEVHEVVVAVEVIKSEAEETNTGEGGESRVESEVVETDVGDGGRSWTARAGVGCWVLCAMKVRVRVRATGVCARFSWLPVCVQVLVPWVVSCLEPGVVVESSWMRG